MEFTTFKLTTKNSQAWVTFDYPPVNIQGIPMIDDLNKLAAYLENDRSIKVVVFQSAHPEIFVAHTDPNLLKDMSTVEVPREEVKTLYLQDTLDRISKLPQATIAKVEGFARGGGHEFTLACDMRFAARGKAKFMQMEVGVGILPCGGGTARMARQVGLGKALEIILSAKDYDADEAEKFGTINKALDPDEIGEYVEALADRISKFPADSIEACKRTIYASIDLPIEEAIKEEAYWLYQSMSKTPAQKRFQLTDDTGAHNDMNNQRNWNDMIIGMQEIK